SVSGVGRHPRILRLDFDACSRPRPYRNAVIEPDRLVDSAQLMETIRPRRADVETKIDFCKRPNGHRHKCISNFPDQASFPIPSVIPKTAYSPAWRGIPRASHPPPRPDDSTHTNPEKFALRSAEV